MEDLDEESSDKKNKVRRKRVPKIFPPEEMSDVLTKKEIKKILGLSDENFDFYSSSDWIVKAGKSSFRYWLKMHNMILERGTVFKYCFEDSFIDEFKEFVEIVKHKSPVKILKPSDISEEDRKRYEGNLKKAIDKEKDQD